MKTLKSIDGKSLLIGGLLACTIFFAMGATGPTDKWDDEQLWQTKVIDTNVDIDKGIRNARISGMSEDKAKAMVMEYNNKVGWKPWFAQGAHIIYVRRVD